MSTTGQAAPAPGTRSFPEGEPAVRDTPAPPWDSCTLEICLGEVRGLVDRVIPQDACVDAFRGRWIL